MRDRPPPRPGADDGRPRRRAGTACAARRTCATWTWAWTAGTPPAPCSPDPPPLTGDAHRPWPVPSATRLAASAGRDPGGSPHRARAGHPTAPAGRQPGAGLDVGTCVGAG